MPWGRSIGGIALGAACALLLAACVAGSAAAVGVSSSKCRPVGSKTLTRDAHARIYTLPTRGPDFERDPESVRVFGCLFGPGRSLLLGTTLVGFMNGSPGRINTEAIAVATPFAAYSTTSQGVDFNDVSLHVRNLRTGAAYTVTQPIPVFGVEQVSAVTDIAVMSSGTAAWIGTGRSIPRGVRHMTVSLALPGQPTTILEEGPGIDPESLRLEGNQLTWTNEGVLHSAEMP